MLSFDQALRQENAADVSDGRGIRFSRRIKDIRGQSDLVGALKDDTIKSIVDRTTLGWKRGRCFLVKGRSSHAFARRYKDELLSGAKSSLLEINRRGANRDFHDDAFAAIGLHSLEDLDHVVNLEHTQPFLYSKLHGLLSYH